MLSRLPSLKREPKSRNSVSVPDANTARFDVFLSYQWSSQDDVKRLYAKLTSQGLKCWMDIHELSGGDNLHEKLVDGIANSRIFLCCCTMAYSQAKNCENELCMAYESNKKIIALMLENLPMSDLNATGLMLARLLRINAFDDAAFFQTDSSSGKFSELLSAIQEEPEPLQATTSSADEIGTKKSFKELFSDLKKTPVTKSPFKPLQKLL